MLATELIPLIQKMIAKHGDHPVAAYPGHDSAFIVEPENVEFYGPDVVERPYFFIAGGEEEA